TAAIRRPDFKPSLLANGRKSHYAGFTRWNPNRRRLMAPTPPGRKSSPRPLARFSPLFLAAVAIARAPSVGLTLVYNEITALSNSSYLNAGLGRKLSHSGNRAVFYHPSQTNDIYVISADGSGQRLVDTYPGDCSCSASVDISGDGSQV